MEIHCVQCGYNLRAATLEGRCPECGAPCRASLWLWAEESRPWRRSAAWGALLLSAGLLLSLLTSFLWYPLVWNAGVQTHWAVDWAVLSILPCAPLLVGSILVTAPRRGFPAPEPTTSPRRLARWAFVIGAAVHMLTPLIQIGLAQRALTLRSRGQEPALVQWALELLPELVFVMLSVGWIAVLWLVERVMRELQAASLARCVRIAMLGLLLCFGMHTVLSIAQMPWPGTGGPLIDPPMDTPALNVASLTIAYATLALLAWSMLVLWFVSMRLAASLEGAEVAAVSPRTSDSAKDHQAAGIAPETPPVTPLPPDGPQ